MWGYEQEGSYVLCSHLRAALSEKVRSWWITCWAMGGEFHRVGLRVGRFVEARPRVGRFMEALYILSPWSIICVFGDDRVTCHMGADDVPSDVGEA